MLGEVLRLKKKSSGLITRKEGIKNEQNKILCSA